MATIADRAGPHAVTSVIIGSRVSACPSGSDKKQAQFRGDLVNLTHTKLIAVLKTGNEGERPHDSDLHVDESCKGYAGEGTGLHTK
jgi:hypothetical protein